MIDKDGTGHIDLQELNLLLLALGKTLPHDELIGAQQSLDLDGSGTNISFTPRTTRRPHSTRPST